jgi:hypothetical protein
MASFHEKIDARYPELDAHHEKMIASQGRTIAKMDAWLTELKAGRKEMAACQEAMEANLDEMKSITVHEEVSKKEAIVKSSGKLKKRRGDRHLPVGRRGEPKERTRGNCGSRMTLAASCKRMTRRAGVARRKGNVVRKNLTRYNVE